MTQDRLLTTTEAAELLTVSTTTVKKLQRTGQLAFIKVGGSTRYSEKEIARYLRSRERRARAA